jgi:hypothetical protein
MHKLDYTEQEPEPPLVQDQVEDFTNIFPQLTEGKAR